jgi:hypothetical protein
MGSEQSKVQEQHATISNSTEQSSLSGPKPSTSVSTYGLVLDDKDEMVDLSVLSTTKRNSDLRINIDTIPVFQVEDDKLQISVFVSTMIYSQLSNYMDDNLSIFFPSIYFIFRNSTSTSNLSHSELSIKNTLDSIHKHGICNNKSYSAEDLINNIEPSKEIQIRSKMYDLEYYRVDNDLSKLKLLINNDQMILINYFVFDNFEDNIQNSSRKGLVRMPSVKDEFNNIKTGLVVGYLDKKKLLIVKGCWGAEWGDNGYIYIPYAYISKYVMDLWVTRLVIRQDYNWKEELLKLEISKQNENVPIQQVKKEEQQIEPPEKQQELSTYNPYMMLNGSIA